MSTVDEVKQKLDIVEVIGQYAKLTKAGRNFKAVCPFHNEKTPSFYVFPERQSWHCFGACATGGDVFTFVMKKEGVEFGEALRMLADKAGVTLPSKIEAGPRKDEKDKLFEVNEAAVQYYHNLLVNSSAGEYAKNYLLGRGLTVKTIGDFQLGISPDGWEKLLTYLKEKNFSENEMLDAGLIVKNEDGRIRDQARANWQAAHRAGQAVKAVLSVADWRVNGTLWQCNQVVACDVPRLGLSGDLLIGEVAFLDDEREGRRTELTVQPPAAFMPDPTQKTRGKGSAPAGADPYAAIINVVAPGSGDAGT